MTKLENGSDGRFAFLQAFLEKTGLQSRFDSIWIPAFADTSEATDEVNKCFPEFVVSGGFCHWCKPKPVSVGAWYILNVAGDGIIWIQEETLH